MPTWNAGQYLQFSDERTQPCRDLMARIPLASPQRIIDLGCGPGNSTEVLIARWPEAVITGLDSSAEMIASARQAHPEREWIAGDIASWVADEPYDLIFSNAALQWVPNHALVYPHILKQVAEGGVFAAQVPGNLDAPAHRLMRELSATAAWAKHFTKSVREWYVHELPFYYDLLAPMTRRLDLWITEYLHILPGPEAVVEWYKGTGLRPFLDALPDPADKERFLAEYLELIEEAFPRQSDGRVLFPFRRLFLIASR
jgi:trans-aconitate 2-methyltransferase